MKQKNKKCRICKGEFTPQSTTQITCSYQCALVKVEKDREQLKKKQEKAWRKEKRERKEKLKSKSDYLREAQTAFNAFIRERDKNENCISCGRPPKKRNAGHYKSVGSHPELRFDEDNCHLQCEHCNTYKSGNQVEYRANLIMRIGIDRVEALESSREMPHWSIEDIKAIKAKYKAKLKELRDATN